MHVKWAVIFNYYRRREDVHLRSSRHRRSRSRSPVLHRRAFSTTLEGSLLGTNGGLPDATTLPPTSLMGSLLASAQAKAAEEAAKANAAKLAAAAKTSAMGSMSAIASAAADMIKAARSGNSSVSGMEGALLVSDTLDKETEQRRLDIEMQKRRERIERWRRERKLKQDILSVQQRIVETTRHPRSAKWNLDDDDDDEDAGKKSAQTKQDTEDEIDPLDAFMKTVNEEVKQYTDTGQVKPTKPTPTQKSIPSNSKPSVNPTKKPSGKKRVIGKGELMESNIDELEYSSEAEEETLEDALAQLQKKDKLLPIDHSQIEYKPFRKNFYIEVPELAKMSKDDVKFYRASLENIRVRGQDCPKPLKNWVQAGVSSRLLACLKRSVLISAVRSFNSSERFDPPRTCFHIDLRRHLRRGANDCAFLSFMNYSNKFEKPTPIQCQALPVIMSGRDMIGIAKTGSGKTLAFLVPLMRHLEYQAPLEPGDGPIALLLTPTRELAVQTFKEAKKLCQAMDARVVCVYGGTGISEQIAELKRGAEIIVCTPGRMIDMLAANGGRVTNLRRCTYVVLDEADRMFDLGFEPQVMRIVENCRPDRQTLMFSATFPRQMEMLARKALISPIEIQVGGRSVVCSDVEQHALILTEDEKFHKVLELLGIYQESGSVLIFVEKQESADELMRVLMKYGYPCLSLHGGLDQYDRDSVITDFKRGNIPLLIATSVAARGLDVSELMLVINYDCPNHYEDYVHRCGRTGRAGNKGFAYTFLTPDQERNAGDIVRAFKQSGQSPPEELVVMWNAYKARMTSEGKKVFGSSGFRGKGFMFDEAEAQLNSEKRRAQKAALGLQDSDDEDMDPNSVDWETKIEDMLASKRKVTDVSKTTISESVVDPSAASTQANQTQISTALALARQKAAQLGLTKNLNMAAPVNRADAAQATTIALLSGNTAASSSVGPAGAASAVAAAAAAAALGSGITSSRTLAEQAAERLHAKLGYSKQGQAGSAGEDEAAPATGSDMVKRFEEELVINDFPQSVRWRITGREMLNHLNDFCNVGVSVRGVYMPPAKAKTHVPEGSDDRPLYLCIEAVSEREIAIAKKEIMRVIKDEMLKVVGFLVAHHDVLYCSLGAHELWSLSLARHPAEGVTKWCKDRPCDGSSRIVQKPLVFSDPTIVTFHLVKYLTFVSTVHSTGRRFLTKILYVI
ncbi:ATP-dependent RNA helicase DDX46/PRP5 [Paragonimus westermani]|uniref:Probable ATP-dependent RNA helicase DDX46 n=1 Tax=Paragonimus westermani TaxID=34504 RepID=A0A5J4NRY0_9TREM|nr:ATP-dependent RNA helicase DDX46/PRP5 [Paragonimus westermani]